MKIIIQNLNLSIAAFPADLLDLLNTQTTTLGTLLMKIEEVKAQLDETNAILENAVSVLNKVQTEVVAVASVQAQTIADLQAKLEAVDTVPADVQASIDTLNSTVGTLITIAQNLDAINPDAIEPAPETPVEEPAPETPVEGTDIPAV